MSTWPKMTERIEMNAAVMLGKPVIRGTRIPVELLLRKLAEGATMEDLLDAHPRLTIEDVRAALGYAAESLPRETVLRAIPGRRELRLRRSTRRMIP